MAQIDINHLDKIEKTRNTIHDKVYTTYTIFELGGKQYIQLDTYGKAERDNPGKISQSLQIDREAATQLMTLFAEAFHLQ